MIGQRAGEPWLVWPARGTSPRARLLCFPFAGGGASFFREWRGGLPATVELCAIQLAGRENRMREPPVCQLSTLVETLGPALQPLLDRPCAFFGHSLGALIGFEVARWLRREHGLLPALLICSGHRAPHLPSSDPPLRWSTDDEFVSVLREMNGTPDAVLRDAELMRLLLPALRADWEMHESYAYSDAAPLACPVAVFGGTHDEQATPEELDAWRRHGSGPFHRRLFWGDHFFIRSNREMVLGAIRTELAGLDAWESGP